MHSVLTRAFVMLASLCCTTASAAARPQETKAFPSLEAQVGQMLVVGFEGTDCSDPGLQNARHLAETGKIGGLVVHNYNVVSPAQLKTLIAGIRSWDVAQPLLITIDQEGGLVQRLRAEKGFTDYASAKSLADQPREAIRATYDALARELADVDIDVNFGPCVDLHDSNSAAIGARGRSFSEDPRIVSSSAALFIEAHHRAKIMTAIKHFVGHGAAIGDTHRGFADITEQYDATALEPYESLIRAGLVDAIMTAHLTNRQLEPSGVPMTFSPVVLEGLLRGKLGFDGVIISDDLQMGALTQNYSLTQIIEGAILAGHDILLFSQNAAADGVSPPVHRAIVGLYEQTLAIVQGAIADGTLTETQVNDHYRRITAMKSTFKAAGASDR